VQFPANVEGILSSFMVMASIDLITDDETLDNVFGFKPIYGMDSHGYEFEEIGYGWESFLYNLGDLAIL
jgi:hypothetical protein